ncbi:hypothetical protein [Dyadobacter fermentans]|uniref:hypothetical protein n=1 Tax=Dyadobacter fermentans TaxID=94254 RepID=UPI0028852C27|nr:hypothetical protein [Dyadobacter fermentans]
MAYSLLPVEIVFISQRLYNILAAIHYLEAHFTDRKPTQQMQRIYINTARVIVLIAIAAMLLLLVQFKLQHWKIGPALYVVLGVLVAVAIGDIYLSKVRRSK